MDNLTKINNNIYRITLPYKDIFTTVLSIECDGEYAVFDAASFDSDAGNYIFPFFDYVGINEDNLKYIFISHNHNDHVGALGKIFEKFPNVTVVSRSPELKERFPGYNFMSPEDGDVILKYLKVVTIPGHTSDSSALLDTRTKILVTGDCMQVYGILGSGLWGANIRFPKEYFDALDKVSEMDIETIYAAHIYEPYGYTVSGRDMVLKYIKACKEPLMNIKELIIENPALSAEEIAEKYNSDKTLPQIATRVPEALKNAIAEGKM